MNLLNLDQAPENPVERIVWLGGVRAAISKELEAAYQTAYFEARSEGMFDAALTHGPYSRKRALAFTRHENEKNGRTIWRWSDGY